MSDSEQRFSAPSLGRVAVVILDVDTAVAHAAVLAISVVVIDDGSMVEFLHHVVDNQTRWVVLTSSSSSHSCQNQLRYSVPSSKRKS